MSNTIHHIYSNNYTIIRHSSIHTCGGNPRKCYCTGRIILKSHTILNVDCEILQTPQNSEAITHTHILYTSCLYLYVFYLRVTCCLNTKQTQLIRPEPSNRVHAGQVWFFFVCQHFYLKYICCWWNLLLYQLHK